MVFLKFFGGMACGLAIPMVSHENVYMTIATCFLRPHLKFRMEQSTRHRDIALSTQALDAYLIDVGKSFALFWLTIGPVIFKTYYLKEDLVSQKFASDSDNLHLIEDKAVTLLKSIKQKTQAEQDA
jgi:hypothetical protein